MSFGNKQREVKNHVVVCQKGVPHHESNPGQDFGRGRNTESTYIFSLVSLKMYRKFPAKLFHISLVVGALLHNFDSNKFCT